MITPSYFMRRVFKFIGFPLLSTVLNMGAVALSGSPFGFDGSLSKIQSPHNKN